jgi:cytochrome c oxidase subunit 7c
VHGYKHIPFNYEGSKAAFGAKVAVFLLAGFSVPFVASYYQLRKAAGGA